MIFLEEWGFAAAGVFFRLWQVGPSLLFLNWASYCLTPVKRILSFSLVKRKRKRKTKDE